MFMPAPPAGADLARRCSAESRSGGETGLRDSERTLPFDKAGQHEHEQVVPRSSTNCSARRDRPDALSSALPGCCRWRLPTPLHSGSVAHHVQPRLRSTPPRFPMSTAVPLHPSAQVHFCSTVHPHEFTCATCPASSVRPLGFRPAQVPPCRSAHSVHYLLEFALPFRKSRFHPAYRAEAATLIPRLPEPSTQRVISNRPDAPPSMITPVSRSIGGSQAEVVTSLSARCAPPAFQV